VTIDGKQISRSLKTKDQRTAKARAKIFETKIINEHFRSLNNRTYSFSQIADAFMAQKHFNSERTRTTCERVITNYKRGQIKGGENSQRLHWRHLSAIYRWAIKEGLCNKNPFQDKPKQSIPHVDYFKEKEVKEILENLPDDRYGDIVRFAFLTGARLGELATLKPENVFPDKIFVTGKTGRRSIPITDHIGEILQRGRIFNYGLWTLSTSFKTHKLSATKIRHTFASTLVKKGVSIYIVAKLLGHKSVKTTETYYAHLAPEEIKNHTDWLGW